MKTKARSVDQFIFTALLILSTFIYFFSNRQVQFSFDTYPNSAIPLHFLTTGSLNLNRLDPMFYAYSSARYAFKPTKTGNISSTFPIGSAIVAAPVALGFTTWRKLRGFPALDIGILEFEPDRLTFSRLASSIIGAFTLALFFLLSRMRLNPRGAVAASVIYGFCTSAWSTNSIALWQHGPDCLMIVILLWSLSRAQNEKSSLAAVKFLLLAGASAGLLPIIRPPCGVFSLAALIFSIWKFNKDSVWFGIGMLSMIPGLLWNLQFGSLLGAYSAQIASFTFQPQDITIAATGLLVSPSRGLLVFSPVLIFGFIGIWKWIQRPTHRDHLLQVVFLAASFIYFLSACTWIKWYGGHSFGPRTIIEIIPILCLGIVDSKVTCPESSKPGLNFALAFSIAFSSLVQFSAAISDQATTWNQLPVDVDQAPSRIWSLNDSQIERSVRALFAP